MINIFLCDDIPVQLHAVRDMVAAHMGSVPARLFCFGSAEEFLSALADTAPDIAVLDISIGQSNGIDLAREINTACPGCKIIFLTAYPQYTSDAYFAEHTWFILKKDVARYLPAALDKALQSMDPGAEEAAVWVRNRGGAQKIPVSRIVYVERVGHRTKIVTPEGALLCRQRPEELLAGVPDGTFIRCHQSFWVNPDKIFSRIGDSFHMIDGSEILISRSRKREAVRIFEERICPDPAASK